MIQNSYLHVPKTFKRMVRPDIVFNENTENEDSFVHWGVWTDLEVPANPNSPLDNYYMIPIDHQERIIIDDKYDYADLSISLRLVSFDLFDIFFQGGKRLLVIVDFDNIPRTPFISSASRILDTNMFNVSLTLKPYNCYRVYKDGQPISEYISYKSLIKDGELQFDPPYPLIIRDEDNSTLDGQKESRVINLE
jgi:hypothetical protein